MLVFQDRPMHAGAVVSRVLALGKECVQLLSSNKKSLQEANSVLFSNHGPITFPRYNIPIRNSKYSYVITDGSVDGTTRAAGAAFVLLQNAPFQVVGVGYMYWPWAHPLRMETEAIRLGIQQARALGLNQIRVCSDSNRVIQLLQGNGIGPPSISLLVETIRAADLHTDPIQFVKVPRAYVMGPDILAKFARKQRKSGYSIGSLKTPLEDFSILLNSQLQGIMTFRLDIKQRYMDDVHGIGNAIKSSSSM
ncbi:hypothetical protein QJS10_CPA10g00608 [Acorus calamus]|uniref:RNase H type-1 domain-containing protein n=1 Tax=Acorus calamus TaxID=4465 RepID=A0AAV9DVL0_ACOCL|nr:hypothetical protein QJS10_CPA10g00608 [Acorus calamus]